MNEYNLIAQMASARFGIASGSFTRPNDTNAYAANDLIANSVTAGSVVPVSILPFSTTRQTGSRTQVAAIRRVRLSVNDSAFAGKDVRVHLFQSAPTFVGGDNEAFSCSESGYAGSVDVNLYRTFSDTVFGDGVAYPGPEILINAAPDSNAIFAVLESLSAVTPAAGSVFNLTFELFNS